MNPLQRIFREDMLERAAPTIGCIASDLTLDFRANSLQPSRAA